MAPQSAATLRLSASSALSGRALRTHKKGKAAASRTQPAPVTAQAQKPAVNVTTIEATVASKDVVAEYVTSRGGSRPLRRILVANNGMAAAKCIMSMRRWAYLTFGDSSYLRFVVMATPEDLNANAEFIRNADDFIEVPGGKNTNNYANVNLIVQTAIREGARRGIVAS
jgi:acetyl-CoA carboxylase/biotin carboxylase 1